jgi:hypothetical protein
VAIRLKVVSWPAKISSVIVEAASQQADIHSFCHQSIALIVRVNAIARIVCRMEHGFISSEKRPGGGKAELTQFAFHIRLGPYAIPKWCATGGRSRDEAGCEGDFGSTGLSDADENPRQVSTYRHCSWRERPSFSR